MTDHSVEDTFRQYRKKQIAEMRPYIDQENMDRISVSAEDKAAGSPKVGDFIARNPDNHADQWLVSAEFVNKNYEPLQFD